MLHQHVHSYPFRAGPPTAASSVSTTRGRLLQHAASAAVTAWGLYLVVKLTNRRRALAASASAELQVAKEQLANERSKTKMERTGRIRAEQELRRLRVANATNGAAPEPQPQPIGAVLTEEEDEEDAEELDSATHGGGGNGGGGSTVPLHTHKREARKAAAILKARAAAVRAAASISKSPFPPPITDAGEEGGAAGAEASTQHPQEQQQQQRCISPAAGPQVASTSGRGSSRTGGAASAESYPLKPIGYIQSCFSTRNGTPRQPLLVPAARARLQLLPDVPFAALEGLEQYSHVWVIYIFHQNTNLPKALQAGVRSGIKAMISVPRLNGGRMGVLATRSPHRPVPIGLSVAQVLSVGTGFVILGGADLVDGSPVLDIKPYVPFCDSLPTAIAPRWVQAEADDEPLAIATVEVPPAAAALLAAAWSAVDSLYPDAAAFTEFVVQVLSRDIRSLHQRLGGGSDEGHPSVDTAAADGPGGTASGTGAGGTAGGSGEHKLYHVVLEGIDVSYVMSAGGAVVVVGARPNQHPDNKRERAKRAAEVHGPVCNRELGTPYC